jgi:hypothetical protein
VWLRLPQSPAEATPIQFRADPSTISISLALQLLPRLFSHLILRLFLLTRRFISAKEHSDPMDMSTSSNSSSSCTSDNRCLMALIRCRRNQSHLPCSKKRTVAVGTITTAMVTTVTLLMREDDVFLSGHAIDDNAIDAVPIVGIVAPIPPFNFQRKERKKERSRSSIQQNIE